MFKLAILTILALGAVVQGTTPNGTYAPGYTQCPANFSIRPANGLSANESAWLNKRRENIIKAMIDYLPGETLPGLNTTQYLQNITANASFVPTSAFTISGGGYKSALTGLGVWQAMDARYPPAIAARTGGLAQCLTYLLGLSGGSAAVSTLASNNYPTVAQAALSWDPTVDVFTGSNLSNISNYYGGIFEDVGAKAQQGFNVSLADIIGRLFSLEFVQGTNGGINKTFSDIQTYSNFSSGLAPMPILSLVEIIKENSSTSSYGGIYLPTNNATLYEYNPFEFGAWDGRVSAFIPTQFLGTSMFNGSAINETCVEGFDQIGFAMGSSSDAWNFWVLESMTNNTIGQFAKRDIENHLKKREARPDAANPEILDLISFFESSFNLSLNDSLYAVYPNPFQGYNNSMVNETYLELVDGSESGQTIPFWPILQPVRGVDFIIAFDASGETPFGWQNGTNIIDTANAAHAAGLPFPKIPSAETMIDFQYNQLPTFFGCDEDTPLVLYISNAPWNAYTNYSFVQSAFYPDQLDIVFDNAFQQFTFANGSSDPEWPACLACALIHGSLKRQGIIETEQCKGCWDRHCWKGNETTKTSSEVTPYEPSLLMVPGLDFNYWNSSVWGGYPEPAS